MAGFSLQAKIQARARTHKVQTTRNSKALLLMVQRIVDSKHAEMEGKVRLSNWDDPQNWTVVPSMNYWARSFGITKWMDSKVLSVVVLPAIGYGL